jgi:hypothetical protein
VKEPTYCGPSYVRWTAQNTKRGHYLYDFLLHTNSLITNSFSKLPKECNYTYVWDIFLELSWAKWKVWCQGCACVASDFKIDSAHNLWPQVKDTS